MMLFPKKASKSCVDSDFKDEEYYWTKSEAWENAVASWKNTSDVYFYDNMQLPIYHTRKYDVITLTCFG